MTDNHGPLRLDGTTFVYGDIETQTQEAIDYWNREP